MCMVAGVDGCKTGWVAILWNGADVLQCVLLKEFVEVEKQLAEAAALTVDMPIGLMEEAQSGGRACDKASRKLLG